VIKNQLLQ